MRLPDWFRPRAARGNETTPVCGTVLRGLVVPPRIALDVPARTGHEALAHAARLLAEGEPHATRDELAALEARERLGTTALGHGCAIPHARMDGLTQSRAAFVRTAAPVPFEAPDGRGVTLFLVLLVPRHANEAHLEMLAAAAERFGDRRFRDALRHCATAHDVAALFDA